LLVRAGIRHNLDGIFSVVPDLTASIVAAAEDGEYAEATAQQRKLSDLLQLITTKYPVMPACSAILQARGIPARIHPMPQDSIAGNQLARFLDEPLVQGVLSQPPRPSVTKKALPTTVNRFRPAGSDGHAAGKPQASIVDGHSRTLQLP
jgi:hypothetical protein